MADPLPRVSATPGSPFDALTTAETRSFSESGSGAVILRATSAAHLGTVPEESTSPNVPGGKPKVREYPKSDTGLCPVGSNGVSSSVASASRYDA